MKTDCQIHIELERLAAAFPWEAVEIWIHREPDGTITHTVRTEGAKKVGIPDAWCHDYEVRELKGDPLENQVDRIIRMEADKHDPERCRQRAMEELKANLAKLQAVAIGLPPYVPNRELAQFAGGAVDVAAQVEQAQGIAV